MVQGQMSVPESVTHSCVSCGVKVAGKKEELIARLLEGQSEDHLLNLPEKDLRDMCIERGLPTEGPRDVLVRRVQDDVAYVMEMSWRRLAAAEAKKKKEKDAENAEKRVKKQHEFSISSLGYTPTKFTAGGRHPTFCLSPSIATLLHQIAPTLPSLHQQTIHDTLPFSLPLFPQVPLR